MRNNDSKSISLILIVIIPMIFLLTACAGNITVKPDYQPQTKADTPLASVPALKIKLLNFEDKREQRTEAILIGRRQAAFGVPMGDVFSDRPIFEIIRDAVKTELIRNGHSIVADNEDISMKGEIRKFWVGTEVTALYWDVIGEVSIVIEVKRSTDSTPILLGPYSGKNVERTYINPSEEIVTRVLMKSLEGVMSSMSSAPELVKMLGTK